MTDPFRLDGRVAVVTGGSQGIGQAVTVALARAGADVVGTYRPDPTPERQNHADETVAMVEALGRRCRLVQADAGDPASAERVADIARDEFGGLHVWINNAARLLVRPFLETSLDDWSALMASNLFGYVYGSRAAVAHMLENGGGRIINVTSVAGLQPIADLSAYIVAKGGVRALTQVLAVEFGSRGIQVNALAPGATDTPLNQHAYTPDVRKTYEERIPLARIASSAEVADAAVFLATDASRYINGAELVCDGGMILNGSVGHAHD